MVECVILPEAVDSGPRNMALDHALLDWVDANPQRAVFRTYGWRAPTLSLGYFQSIAEVRADSRWRDVAVVRRPTGGGAIWHANELTYALVVPRALEVGRRAADLYRAVHRVFVELLREEGAAAARRAKGNVEGARKEGKAAERPFLCFEDRDAEDVVIGPRKVVGSAQRRRPHAVLQHGSILLAADAGVSVLRGDDTSSEGLDAARARWASRLSARLPEALRLRGVEGVADELVFLRADNLAREVYASEAWTARR